MRINFVVNTTGVTGGIRVVFEYANRLQASGHEVKIVHVFDLSAGSGLSRHAWRAWGKRVKYACVDKVGWFDLRAPVLRVPRLLDRHLPDADVVIATANETADGVAALAPSKGVKFYLVQHFEDWSRPPHLVARTWKLPLKKIVVASWLERLAHGMGEAVVACIPNGVNLAEFHCEAREYHDPPRILMMTHVLPWKGTRDGLEAFELLRRQGREFTLTLFGLHRGAGSFDGARFVSSPTGEALRRLYCGHDIFVSPSWKEGFQLPPMEAMACGCAVVATNVGGVPDYAIPDETALVVEPRLPSDLAAAIGKLIEDSALLQRLAERGREHIQSFTWDKAAVRFERALSENVH